MSGRRRVRSHIVLVVAFLLGSVLLLSCQQAAVPQATPKPAETAAGKPAATAATAAPTKPAAQAAEKPVRGGTLRIANTAEFSSLDANTTTGQNGFYAPYEQLIEPDKDGGLTKEGLASDWSVGSDGKSITFKLRAGVKFHDGTDFNAAAVKSNVDRMKDPATKSPFTDYYFQVTSVEVVDPLTVRFNLNQPDVLLLARLAGGAGGLMVSPAAVKKYGQDIGRNPVGTGPFQFVEWKTGDRVTLKRFEGYWKKDKDGNQLPYLDQVIYQFIPDESVILANLRTGLADLKGDCCGVTAPYRPQVKNDPNLTYQVRAGSNSGTAINTKRAPFDNKALRQAVALAVDREGIASRLDATPSASIISPAEKAYDDGKSGVFPARDLAKAKAKMAEAGYAAGGLKVKYTGNNTPDAVIEAQIVKANLAEIGIEVELEALASSAWNTKVRLQSDYQIATGGHGILVGDPGHVFNQYWYSKGSRNFYGPYSNPKFDEPLEKALVTYDQKARAALYNEAVKVMAEDVPWVPLYSSNLFPVTTKKVRNYFVHPLYFDRIRDVWMAP